MGADPVMVVVRVKAPADVDPYTLEAELTRAICARPMTAELVLLPSWRRRSEGGLRRHDFVALLCAARTRSPSELTRAAEKIMGKAVRKRFGVAASAKVRPARSPEEIDAFWCSLRGTPCRL
ncbi:hypothetical protein FHX44_114147 [Pseudonocardia hierapolitana]|uniref:Tautomerase-like protein n=1 Tax=Pseudonocardia hierapolitana TaxID=1128676 RepID=A0A561STP3_9PSEU|nr:hypothetical protein [Pseudonocardia hierapolitana]TWF78227.1 hypothetical protein FHX44_114147 [Pseudonocardia hierapolitana]